MAEFLASSRGNSTKRQIGHLCLQDSLQNEKPVSGSSVEEESPIRDTDQSYSSSIGTDPRYPPSSHHLDPPAMSGPSADYAGDRDRDALANVNLQTAYNEYNPSIATNANFGQSGLNSVNLSSDQRTLAADPFTDYIFRSLQQGRCSGNLDTSAHRSSIDLGQTPDWEQLLASLTEPMPGGESPATWPLSDPSEVASNAHLHSTSRPNRRASASSIQSLAQHDAIETESNSAGNGLDDEQP